MKIPYFRPAAAILLGLCFFSLSPSSLWAGQPQRIETENGLTLLVQEARSLPIVTIKVIVKAGGMREIGRAHV